MSSDTIELTAVLAANKSPRLADVLARPGTRVVLLAGSKDPNAKATLILLDNYGPAFVVKVPTTRQAQNVVRHEGNVLDALAGLRLGPLAASLPRALGYMSVEGLMALVSTAVTGTPMTVRYHGWRHTARKRHVTRDFAAAGAWLADLQSRTSGHRRPITLLSDVTSTITSRYAKHPDLPTIRVRLAAVAARLEEHTTPRTVVHGDYWFGNLLLDEDSNRVIGVVDWESGAIEGEPLRDVARFAVSYALYLDRHTRAGGRVVGHRAAKHDGLRADLWGSGVAHAMRGGSWFADVVKVYVRAALARLGVPTWLWRDVLLAGIADVAATADHPDFAEAHLDLFLRVSGDLPVMVREPVARWERSPVPVAEVQA
jgi:aminoglycoside phosphotransferase (APT) family kinase protein